MSVTSILRQIVINILTFYSSIFLHYNIQFYVQGSHYHFRKEISGKFHNIFIILSLFKIYKHKSSVKDKKSKNSQLTAFE